MSDIEYQIVKSKKRKTVGLQVKNGRITVRAPFYLDESYIKDLVQQKSDWLLKKQLLQQEQSALSSKEQCFTDQSSILLLGIEKKIQLCFGSKTAIEESESSLNICLPCKVEHYLEDKKLQKIKKAIEGWFKKRAIKLIESKVAFYSEKLRLFPTQVKVKKYKARWGSCNNKHELSFNYLLMMVPEWVIDYVVVHELCHIAHLNHSPAFWNLVEVHYPNFKAAKSWLRSNQSNLIWG